MIKVLNMVYWKLRHMLLSLFPLRDVVLLESLNGFDGSSRAIYEYMVANEKFHDYRFVWVVKNKQLYQKINRPRTIFINYNEFSMDRERAKYSFWEFKSQYFNTSDQTFVWLSHGQSPIKGSKSFSINGMANYFICTSKDMLPIIKSQINICDGKEIICELPRNDFLWHPYDLSNYVGKKKMILFMPTFRQSDELKIQDAKVQPLFDIPAMPTVDCWYALDKVCSNLGVCIILKPHPKTNVTIDMFPKLDNIFILSNMEIQENDLNLYRLLGAADGLMTDYSSVSFDYLLLNRPIAYDISDLRSGNYTRELWDNDIEKWMPGKMIYTYNDIVEFITMVSKGIDLYKEERTNLCNMVHTYFDDKNSERLVESIFANE